MNLASNTQIGSILVYFHAIASVLILFEINIKISHNVKQDDIGNMFDLKVSGAGGNIAGFPI